MPVRVLEALRRPATTMSTAWSTGKPVALAHELRDGRPLDVLHHDEVAVRLRVVAGVVDLDDVGVDELCGGQRLAPEARHEAVVLGQVLGQQLDRDLALEHVVERAVDGRHAAGAEALVEPVAARDLDVRAPPSLSAAPRRHGASVLPVTPVLPSCPVAAGASFLSGRPPSVFFGFLSFLPLSFWFPGSASVTVGSCAGGSSTGAAGCGSHWSATSVSSRVGARSQRVPQVAVHPRREVNRPAGGTRRPARWPPCSRGLRRVLDLVERRPQVGGTLL